MAKEISTIGQSKMPQKDSEFFHVSNVQNYISNLKTLAKENPDWHLSPEELIASGKVNRAIFRIKFVTSPIRFSSENDITYVTISEKIVGELDQESTAKLRNIFTSYDITGVRCAIQGGMYKVVDQNGNIEIQQKGLSVALEVTYQPKVTTTPTTKTSHTRTPTRRKPAKKASKTPLYKRWWFWLIAAALVLGSCNNNSDNNEPIETTPPTSQHVTVEATEITQEVTTEPTTVPTAAPTTAPTTTPTEAPTTTEKKEEMVWVTPTGNRYHRKSKCGSTKSSTQVTISEAKSRGLTPCGTCYK